MKKYLILVLSAALLMAFFGCGSPKDTEPEGPPVIEGAIDTEFELPDPESIAQSVGGESGSKLYKFTGDYFTKIKGARAGSFLEVQYETPVSWGCGEIGWVSIENAGPAIHGRKSSKEKRTASIPVEFIVLGTDNFTIHIFNNADVKKVILHEVPEDYVVVKDPRAKEGGTQIFVPFGNEPEGKGDVSKADINKILAAPGTAKLVFYFGAEETEEAGILKLASKKDYTGNYDLDKTLLDWVRVDSDKKASIAISEIKAAMTGNSKKLDINLGENTRTKLEFIQIEP